MTDFFKGRTLVIATRHGKEQVMAPLLEESLGVVCIAPENLDTDRFGTFSGEKERVDDVVTTLRKKCKLASEITGVGLAAASEGSFGPHPMVFAAYADEEFVMLADFEKQIEIVESTVSFHTNFDGALIYSEDQLLAFARKIGFPSHGIILKDTQHNWSKIIKENLTVEQLKENYLRIRNPDGVAYAETDMRAMRNPTRMKVIAEATKKLIEKIQSVCPVCGVPGFAVSEIVKGLPCELCNLPTRTALKHIYRCQKCGYESCKDYPAGKQFEDPQFCDFCNP
ncbi:MAG: hypothetical protein NZ529_05100 [Cytophagaceae bacterium]|nr:hypothetical protein [Cytophagaceae bacterium]MDW8456153.1 hypothetical protein [Cytophagaceae bacterium]